MMKLRNTMTRKVEEFHPIDEKNVRVYACGPTVYDRAHLGNARPAVVFDVLARVLREIYGAEHVTYVRNITDVDDKINARAAETGRSIRDITEETVGWYHDDMGALGVKRPDHEPRATEYIAPMQEMIADLIRKGFAYEAEGHVLFDVTAYADYGALSGRSLEDMIAGARVEVAPFKRNPQDFVLWKPAGDGPGWDSPWGNGRPGWHIECSAMSKALLGEVFDIHAGGIDLQFPHHENERAQSCCANGTSHMANYWVHNEMLQVEGMKMSKSLGNFFTVRDLLDQGVAGEVIRFVLLGSHYSKPMDWTEKKRHEAEQALRRWRSKLVDVEAGAVDATVLDALKDDLNTAGALSALYALEREGRFADLKASAALLGLLSDELGGWDVVEVSNDVNSQIEALLVARAEAKKAKDFARADAIRDGLIAAGVEVKDTPQGAAFVIGADFDEALLPEY